MLGRTPCDICKGACCESFAVNFSSVSQDDQRFLGFHGRKAPGGRIEFECRCEHLDTHGKCKIYDTRPEVCKRFPVGSKECFYCINSRRPLITATKIKLAIARMGKEQ